MPDLQVVFEDNNHNFSVLSFDVDVSQKHRLQAAKTEFPIERQADRGDHHRAKPDSFSAEIIVSDTPTTGIVGAPRVRDAWALLRRARDEHLATFITTSLRTYDDMVLLEAEATSTYKDGTWLRVQVTFEQLIVFDTETVPIQPARSMPRAAPPVDIGAQATTPLPVQRATLLVQGLDLGFQALRDR